MIPPDENDDLITAALHVAGASASRSAQCPDESDYWVFLENDDDVAVEIRNHVVSCPFCLSEMRRLVSILDRPISISAAEERHINAALEARLPDKRSVSLRRVGNILETMFNPFPLAAIYRSTQSEAIAILETTRVGDFVVEFMAGSREGHTEIILQPASGKNQKQQFRAELWRDGALVRSLPMTIGQRSTLSQWPKGNYRLALFLDDTPLSHIDIALL